jgi:hypothetical protein
MSITVKKLIKELEKIENKFLEVEFLCTLGTYEFVELDRISRHGNKIVIFSEDKRLK